MSSEGYEASTVEHVEDEKPGELNDSAVKPEPEKALNDFPASTPSDVLEERPPSIKTRLFNRQRSLHSIFGGGKAADTLLWRNKLISAGILVVSTVAYFILEHSGWTLLSVISNLLLITFVVLFIWSNAAVFLNRPPPPLPNLHISEEAANSLALALREQVNKVLACAHDIALGKDFKQFLKVMAILWGLSIVGGWFHFLTLVYLGVLLSHSIPVVYETYEDQIEFYAKRGFEEAHKHYKKVDETFLSKVFNKFPKLKKTE